MSVKGFHRFLLNEERGEDLPPQNEPSKSGIKYKENVRYADPDSSDFGKESVDAYIVLLNNAIRVMNKISLNVTKISANYRIFTDSELRKTNKPESPQSVKIKDPKISEDLVKLADSLSPTYESHKQFWNGLVSLAREYSGWSEKLGSTRFYGLDASGTIKTAYGTTIKKLESEIESLKKAGNKETELEKKEDDLSQIKKALRKEIQEKDVKGILFTRKLDEILTLYIKAIEAYKNGAIQELTQMENESQDEGKSRLNSLTGKTIRALKSTK